MDLDENKEPTENFEFENPRVQKEFELIRKAQQGDHNAMTTLMKRYNKALYYVVLKIVRNVDDAEDITVETFVKAFQNLDKFRFEHPFSSWLFRIGTNHCIDFIRKKKRVEIISIDQFMKKTDEKKPDKEESNDFIDEAQNIEQNSIRSQQIEVLRLLISKLPTNYRKVLTLRYFEDMDYQQIAEELDIPMGTVKAQLFRAKELLNELIRKHENLK
ncbi:RNA polymerase sigma factor [Raineya orbicola]|jgi:RNA polymerase sigma-70 factor (ECF subfamily)|uniref:Sigma70-ECF: RNA polymerase sigma factor, sigma-70 family n=1 Tax=Raineya orbicola TaxID=2016530 RepID=A0A2N3IJA8_9BACT|nr:sigma-70 family RNA polymerase sigma factor [Raineya orbicola]PKQ70397.1 sigma70-ECF: RNA polymerase sigma factor, sigma-70 family [Raineya orbicola]